MQKKKTLSDAQILQEVLNALDYSANALNDKLEYSSPSSVPHVLKGRNELSRGMKQRIVNTFPNVNMEFLNKGELPILLTGGAMQAQANLLNIAINTNQGQSPMLDLNKLAKIPQQLDRIETMLQELLSTKKGPTE
tara:strand:+ start:6214 stop:6621 length:408 start_codon:yes stop_codon:yes gene_type:complete